MDFFSYIPRILKLLKWIGLPEGFWPQFLTLISPPSFMIQSGFVIQPTGRVEFDDGLRTGVLHGDCWCNFGDCIKLMINPNPLLGQGLVLGFR